MKLSWIKVCVQVIFSDLMHWFRIHHDTTRLGPVCFVRWGWVLLLRNLQPFCESDEERQSPETHWIKALSKRFLVSVFWMLRLPGHTRGFTKAQAKMPPKNLIKTVNLNNWLFSTCTNEINTLANPSHKPKNGKSEIFGISFFAT